ncbi:c-type cytochrome [Cytophaga hutchinsonii]|uniref:Cytochrome c551/c552 n=1 Tax=Cytophaga hutchinsonii (strain ATCC 33406 / DSM 1761 / CIP 103989 / NBRC 15051 / NCIMB 9469 / D465) TaxID=269798 RepID=A0A6N4SNJ8_CYTH3|nr:cytochrome c [Cytophaga hutchinsonii]ABG57846.1 cytochrome c551/c552 [Cytophaga hutchinsonii ATCC 33406]
MNKLLMLALAAATIVISYAQNAPGTAQKGAVTVNPKDVEAGKALVAQSDCKTCHVSDYTLIGPGYKQIAQRYPLTETNIQYLSKKIISGGGGVWGENEMAAHTTLTPEQTRKIALYILSLK